MKSEDRTIITAESIAKKLRETIGEVEVERLARECGLLRRKRDITPVALLVACLSTLGVTTAHWIADIVRTFNAFSNKPVQYKPFHNQMAKKAFPKFMKLLVERALTNLAVPILTNLSDDKLALFRDIMAHDGCSFSLKDSLAKEWPGRFTKVSPAAVELHATMSMTTDKLLAVTLAPDKETEHAFAPDPSEMKGCLLLEDRGYENRQVFKDIQAAGGSYIIRGKSNIRPTIRKAYSQSGRRLRHLEGKKLQWKILPQETVDLDLDWGKGKTLYQGRLVAIYKRGKRNKKTFIYLHTNLDRRTFHRRDVGSLYRLRWQIDLLFKEWKSHANLHRFDTGKSAIAEGLIWASILTAALKRFVVHATESCLGIELSTQRGAACARHFFDDILCALCGDIRILHRRLKDAMAYLAQNARRAHPERDRKRGRLASGLRPISTQGSPIG